MARVTGGSAFMPQVRLLSLVAILALGAFFAFAHERAIDPALHEAYGSGLARLQTLDHSLAEDLIRARTGLLANYDPLVQTIAELRALHDRLARVPPFLGDAGAAELSAAVLASTRALEEQAALIERFKSENAVLLNSLRFLPVAAADLAERSTDAAASARTDALVRDLLVFNLWHEEPQRIVDRTRAALDELEAIPGVPGDELDLLDRHASVILERRPRVDALMAEIFALQSARGDDRLDAIYRVHHAASARASARDDTIVFALALATVILLAALVVLRFRRAAQTLQHTSEQLAAAVDMKNRFVSMTSHEFRTPLSTILSSTELLEAYADRWRPEKKQEHFDRIRGSVQEMTQLIDGILLIGRGEAGVLDFKPAPTDLDRICREVVGSVQARTGGQRAIEYQPPGVSEVIADERLIRHVLDNLLTNALKYSPAGGKVELVARCDGRETTLIVGDEGLGIPETDRARLFESFRRGTNVGAIPGTGLGLAVVKRAIDLHRGRIEVTSAVGSGSRFEVTLPASGAEQRA